MHPAQLPAITGVGTFTSPTKNGTTDVGGPSLLLILTASFHARSAGAAVQGLAAAGPPDAEVQEPGAGAVLPAVGVPLAAVAVLAVAVVPDAAVLPAAAVEHWPAAVARCSPADATADSEHVLAQRLAAKLHLHCCDSVHCSSAHAMPAGCCPGSPVCSILHSAALEHCGSPEQLPESR